MTAMPLHERIRSDIESLILSGELGPGDRIPFEAELTKQYGCARMTVNKALSALAAAGLLDRRKRAGTFVARPRTQSMVLDVPDLPVQIAARGQSYRYQLLSRKIRRATAGDAAELAFAGKGRIVAVDGLHLADGQPLAFEQRLVSLAAVPAIEAEPFTQEPPGSWLLRHVPWTEAETRIGATNADAVCAALLNIAPGAGCLTVERRTWRGREGITLVRQNFVPGAYELVARFGPAQATAGERPAKPDGA